MNTLVYLWTLASRLLVNLNNTQCTYVAVRWNCQQELEIDLKFWIAEIPVHRQGKSWFKLDWAIPVLNLPWTVDWVFLSVEILCNSGRPYESIWYEPVFCVYGNRLDVVCSEYISGYIKLPVLLFLILSGIFITDSRPSMQLREWYIGETKNDRLLSGNRILNHQTICITNLFWRFLQVCIRRRGLKGLKYRMQTNGGFWTYII